MSVGPIDIIILSIAIYILYTSILECFPNRSTNQTISFSSISGSNVIQSNGSIIMNGGGDVTLNGTSYNEVIEIVLKYKNDNSSDKIINTKDMKKLDITIQKGTNVNNIENINGNVTIEEGNVEGNIKNGIGCIILKNGNVHGFCETSNASINVSGDIKEYAKTSNASIKVSGNIGGDAKTDNATIHANEIHGKCYTTYGNIYGRK